MDEYIEVGRTGTLKEGTMTTVQAGGRELLLAMVGKRYFVADNRCPHFGGRLSMGKLDRTVVTCPVHGSQFDLADGHVIRWTNWSGLLLSLSKIFKPPRSLKMYPVKIEADKIMALLK